MGEIFERIGRWLEPLGVPADAQFDCASALTNYSLGAAGQNAANEACLEAVATVWIQDDPASRPFLRRVAAQLSEHDDRQQFLAGVGLTLAAVCINPSS